VWQAILPVRMGLRPMKGDKSLAHADYQSAARCHLAPQVAIQPGRGFRPCSRLSGGFYTPSASLRTQDLPTQVAIGRILAAIPAESSVARRRKPPERRLQPGLAARIGCPTNRRRHNTPKSVKHPVAAIAWRRGRNGNTMLIAGTGGRRPAPATDLLVGLTLPQEPYSDPSEQRVDGFYQQLDHRLILLSASIGEPGPYRAFLYEASIRNPLLQFPRKEFIGGASNA